mmetsp:Transcript_36930/g.68170  ORF Transcript_36930/g.68170 Transcript_36930/m.68170 type:complete len:105 (-) Transcript_36930:129-443(-)
MPEEKAEGKLINPKQFGGKFTQKPTTTTTVTEVQLKPDKNGPTEGVGVNKKATGGSVKTWMPTSKEEREKLSDAMADKVLGNLSALDIPKKTKPSWMKKKKGKK